MRDDTLFISLNTLLVAMPEVSLAESLKIAEQVNAKILADNTGEVFEKDYLGNVLMPENDAVLVAKWIDTQEDMKTHIATGNKIQAIKEVRARCTSSDTGRPLPLKSSKDGVEAWMDGKHLS